VTKGSLTYTCGWTKTLEMDNVSRVNENYKEKNEIIFKFLDCGVNANVTHDLEVLQHFFFKIKYIRETNMSGYIRMTREYDNC